MPHVTVQLHRGRARRLREGHPWVFANEIVEPVKDLPPGGTVDVVDDKGSFVGRGYANPASLIAIRLLTRNKREDVDHPAFLVNRLRQARAYRECVLPGRRDLRWVYSEGDGLPGLVVDGYGDVLAVQLNTLGMELRKEQLREALHEVFAPRGVVLRNEGRHRGLEGLSEGRELWWGDVPESIDIDEHGVAFRVAPLAEQVGHFYDQATNRQLAASFASGKRVLDVYAHDGAWAMHCLAAGAAQAVVLDRDEHALALAEANGALNGVSDRLVLLQAEGKQALQHLVQSGDRFDLVVVDPPAFAKVKKNATAALRGYRDVSALALSLVAPGGLYFPSSCSFHVTEDNFLEAIADAARSVGRRLRLLRRGAQSFDHPVVPNIPETRYLKSLAFHVELDA